jgi:hypothetical protein
MPAKSGKQYRLMAMIAAGKKPSKSKSSSGVGPSEEVAKEFVSKTPEKKRKLFMRKRDG